MITARARVCVLLFRKKVNNGNQILSDSEIQGLLMDFTVAGKQSYNNFRMLMEIVENVVVIVENNYVSNLHSPLLDLSCQTNKKLHVQQK